MAINKQIDQLFFQSAQQEAFLNDWYALMVDGFTPTRAIEKINEFATGHSKLLCQDILLSVSQGGKLAVGFDGWFNKIVVDSIAYAEDTGLIKNILPHLIESYTKEQSIIPLFLMKVMYPFSFFVVICFLYVILHKEYVPEVTLLTQGDLPLNIIFIDHFGWFIAHYYWLIILIVGLLAMYLRYYLVNVVSRQRLFLDQVLLFKQYRQVTYANLLTMIALLMRNGLKFRDILSTLKTTSSPYLYHHLQIMQKNMRHTKSIAEAMDTGLIDAVIISRLNALSETSGFAEAVSKMARRARDHAYNGMVMMVNVSFVFLMCSVASLIGVALFALVATSTYI
jgi:type II secretory pathway component PulF